MTELIRVCTDEDILEHDDLLFYVRHNDRYQVIETIWCAPELDRVVNLMHHAISQAATVPGKALDIRYCLATLIQAELEDTMVLIVKHQTIDKIRTYFHRRTGVIPEINGIAAHLEGMIERS